MGLPKEEVKIYEFDQYRHATSTSARFSQRSSFFSYVSRVTDTLASVEDRFGTAFSSTASVAGSSVWRNRLGYRQLWWRSFVTSASVSISNHLNVDSVFESFRHVAEISSQAVETERSIVVNTFDESVNGINSTFRTLRDENHCRAVTYFIRRVFEVYCLSTSLFRGMESTSAGIGSTSKNRARCAQERDLEAVGPDPVIGQVSQRSTEIAIPTDGLLFEAELAHCSSCEPELEKRIDLELKKLELEVELLERENERRKGRRANGDFSEFDHYLQPAAVTP